VVLKDKNIIFSWVREYLPEKYQNKITALEKSSKKSMLKNNFKLNNHNNDLLKKFDKDM